VAFRTAEATDPGDRNGAGLRLMRLGATDLAGMRPTYLMALFDQYASRFDAALMNDLGYRGPALLLAAVAFTRAAGDISARHRSRLRHRARGSRVLVDRGRNHRHRPVTANDRARPAEIVAGLGGRPDACADLILAADVMVYVHDMTLLLREAARVLVPGGLFALTVESHAGEGVVLGEALRYSHSGSFVRGLVATAGLVLERLESASSRTESGVDVPGLVVVAGKS
jgi:predicted TPR repeat methyltransferase